MARWGNALGGWRKQRRNALGQFGGGSGSKMKRRRKKIGQGRIAQAQGRYMANSIKKKVRKKQAKQAHRARKQANARAHRARVRGSVKARGREFATTSPRRSKDIAIGAAAYTLGRSSGSRRMQSYGLQRAQRGVKASAGRTSATIAMSKGLKNSRNRASKDQYLKDIGRSRAKRNAMKLAAGAAVVGATAYGLKKGNIQIQSQGSGSYSALIQGGGRHAYAATSAANGIASFTGSAKVTKKGTAKFAKRSYDYGENVRAARKRAAQRGFVI